VFLPRKIFVSFTAWLIIEWFINCGRQDSLNKSIAVPAKYYRVCLNHFSENMFLIADKSRLLSKAVPTEFVNFNFNLILLYVPK